MESFSDPTLIEFQPVYSIYIPRHETCCEYIYKYFWYYCCSCCVIAKK